MIATVSTGRRERQSTLLAFHAVRDKMHSELTKLHKRQSARRRNGGREGGREVGRQRESVLIKGQDFHN